jgi:hypothetical protein
MHLSNECITFVRLKGRANRPYIFTKCGRKGTADGKIEGFSLLLPNLA